MSDKITFDGQVVLVTGAGNGLGRIYALDFAERGAKVVVNDLGGDFKGTGQSTSAADKVVNEIRAKGGIAVANYDSVEFGEKLVQTAIDSFGRIDVVVNNAGILRDKSFARISDLDWDLIHKVHLRGTFSVTRAAWTHMKKQNFGRIVMVSSPAGIYGNFGQANYSAAKLGVVGLSNTLAQEGAKYNIRCNTIAPIAGSRMTETVMPEELVQALKPEYVSPLVLYLAHRVCEATGGLYEVGAGWAAKIRWQRGAGALIRKKDTPMTVEQVRDSWSDVVDFSSPSYPGSTKEQTSFVVEALSMIESGKTEVPKAGIFEYTDRESILYALGIGVSTSQPNHLRFLYENSEDFTAFPTYSVIPAFTALLGAPPSLPSGVTPDMSRMLHGEQYTEMFKPMPTAARLTSKSEVADVLDKGSGAVVIQNINTYDEAGEKVAFNQVVTFFVGAGGFGGKRSSDKLIASQSAPKRAPDHVTTQQTTIDQAALYRLSGDRNPLHIDPAFSVMGGFKDPILHGLCSFGFVVRHVVDQYASGDAKKFKCVKVRFASPVLPGQTIRTEMWKEGNRVFFQAKVAETDKVCISGAYVDLHPGAESATNTVSKSSTSEASASTGLKSEKVFAELTKRIKDNQELLKKINGVFLFDITKNNELAGQWTVDLKSPPGSIYKGEPKGAKPGCTLRMSDDNFEALVAGKINAQQAFMSGKVKVKGNIMLVQKLSELFKDQAKL